MDKQTCEQALNNQLPEQSFSSQPPPPAPKPNLIRRNNCDSSFTDLGPGKTPSPEIVMQDALGWSLDIREWKGKPALTFYQQEKLEIMVFNVKGGLERTWEWVLRCRESFGRGKVPEELEVVERAAWDGGESCGEGCGKGGGSAGS